MEVKKQVIIRTPQPSHSLVARYEWRDQYGHLILDETYHEAKERLGGNLYRYAVLKGSKPEPREEREDYEEKPKRQRKNNSKF
jgi:hypothetical protein